MKRLCILIIFIIIGSGIYFNSLKNAFHYDDQHHILGNSYIRTVGNIPLFFTQPRSFSVRSTLHPHYRPLVMTSYTVNYYFGGIDPRGYHLVNLGFHIGSAFMLFLILQAILGGIHPLPNPPPASHKGGRENGGAVRSFLLTAREAFSSPPCGGRIGGGVIFIALAAGLLFLATPYNSEVVNYISARSTVMCTFFYLLAFYFWVKYRTPPPFPPPRGGRVREGVFFYIASIISFLLAMLTKEIAITLPVIILLYDVYFVPKHLSHPPLFHPPPHPLPSREGGFVPSPPVGESQGEGGILKSYTLIKHYIAYLPFVIVGSLTGVLLRIVFFKKIIQEKDTDLLAHLVIQTKVIAKYFYHMAIPANHSVEHLIKETPNIYFFLSFILTITLLALVYLLWRSRDIQWQTGSFFIAWFFIALLPTSFVALNFPYQENRGYLSAVGFAVLAAVGLDKVRKRIAYLENKQAILGYSLIGILVLAYSIGVVQRNKVWLDKATLWSDVLEKYPRSITAHLELGNHYLDSGQLDLALTEYERIIEIDPYEPRGLTNMGVVYKEKGNIEKAEELFERSLKINQADEVANLHMAKILQSRGDLSVAAMHLLRILSISPDHIQIATILIDVFDKMGVLNEFHKGLLKAIKGDPDNPAMIKALGLIYMKKGQWREAAQEFERVLSYMPDDPKTLLDLGNVYSKMGLTELAEEKHMRVVALYPKDYFAYQSLALIYQEQGKFDKALPLYEKALEGDPKAYKAYNNIGFIYTRLGEDEKAIDAFKKAIEVDPSYHLARLNLAKVYERRDKKGLAMEEYRKILRSVSPEGKDRPLYLAANKGITQIGR